MKKTAEVTKPKMLKLHLDCIFPYSEVNEIGRYRKDAPCVLLSVWSGMGYALEQFVVWDCAGSEEALERFAAAAVRKKWTGLYITQDAHEDERAEAVRDVMEIYASEGGPQYREVLTEDAEAVVDAWAEGADQWIAGKVAELRKAVDAVKDGDLSELSQCPLMPTDQRSIRRYAEIHYKNLEERETVLTYINTAFDALEEAVKVDERFDEYYNYLYIDYSCTDPKHFHGPVYIRSENLGIQEFDSGAAFVAAVCSTGSQAA